MPKRKPAAKRNPSIHADRRYLIEILLPVRYNDGRRIEFEKFTATVRELFAKFGGMRWTPAQNTPPFEGLWQEAGQTYSDLILTLLIETAHDNRVFRWLHTYKREREARFEQVVVYITVSEILRVL